MNIWLIIADPWQLSSCVEIKSWKKSGLHGIRTHDCDTIAVLYQLSYQAIWELVILWVRNIPVKNTSEYMKDRKFELWSKVWCTQLGLLPIPGSRSVGTIKKADAGRAGGRPLLFFSPDPARPAHSFTINPTDREFNCNVVEFKS